MVKRTAQRAHKPVRRRAILTRKLFRDMSRSAMQFIAMLLLCAMGTWVFSGLDANWRILEASTETYFENGNLADLWVKGSAFTRQDVARVAHLPGVRDVQPRVTMELDCPDLPGEVSLAVSGFDGEMRICTPLVRRGEALLPSDLRGCLLEEQFAQHHGLTVGDRITVDVMGQERTFVIRGIILSSEYLLTARTGTPEPDKYGFLYVSARALPELPFTEMLVELEEGADAEALRSEIARLLPSSMALTQRGHASTMMARNFVSMFRSLSYLFPLLVYLIAAMIVVSTLNRMMENQRIQMGTLKALGYRDRQIRGHYLSYALVPSLVGSTAGVVLGYYTIPPIIWPIVSNNLRYPERLSPPISALSWAIAGLSVILCVLICLRTYRRAAKETTASLLRPKPPRSGARILLERIPWLWRRFSFNTKMIVRNLMRNKGRTVMSMVGILCCNALIICTFGLQESFDYFIGAYYDGTLRYDVRADLVTGRGGTLESYRRRLDAQTVDGVMELGVSVESASDKRSSMLSVLAEDQNTMFLGDKGTMLPLPENGVVMSRKLAELMDVQIGDEIGLWITGDDERIDLTVRALADTNLSQGVFMGQGAWEGLRRGDMMPTALLIAGPEPSCTHQLDEMREVSGLRYPAQEFVNTIKMLDSTRTAFTILSVAALALAFIICYNMGLMNFTERTRDYATLKVLGYHQREIRRLMLRENNYTTLLGLAVSIPPGIWLTDVILKMCEYDSMVFVANVTLPSIAGACVITYVFSFFIQSLLTRKVRTIDMVEALKSVE